MKVGQYDLIKSDKISSRQKIILFLILLFMIPLFFIAKNIFTSFAQTKIKNEKVIKKVSFDNEPIEFLKIESDGKTIKPNEKFIQEDDWLKDFTIKFKNTSGKPINYVSIVLMFPETGFAGSPMVYYLKYGANPEIKSNEKSASLAPEDSAEVKFSPEKYKGLKKFLISRSLLSDLTEVNYRIMVVYFEDGTLWSSGSFLRPDPNKPGRHILVEDKSEGGRNE